MSVLDKHRWEVVSPWLDRLLDADDAGREVLLATLRADDPALAAELEGLLARQTAVDRVGFLEGSTWRDDATLAGRVLGNYTLEASIGQGGMGNVWLARRSDGRYEGHAAVKFLNVAMIGRSGVERFEREGRILGRLAHPHIARLIDAGVDAGQPYLVLEYVEGTGIDAWCDAQRLDVRARLALFVDVLAAVAHAHSNLILHRDLKPSNILVGRDGQVKLLDFGIAKLLDDDDGAAADTLLVTQGAGRAFTPEYASPEQVQGEAVTTATDVYALGVLLYRLLCGQHPTTAAGAPPARRLRDVVETDATRLSDAAARCAPEIAAARGQSPSRLARALRGDLDHLVAKALKKSPAERYANAAAFAADVRRFLDGEAVEACADSLRYRAGKFVRRNRLVVGAVASVVLVSLVGGAVAQWQAREAAHERDRAIAQLDRAEAISEFLTFLLSEASPSGRPFTTEDLVDRGEQLIVRAFPQAPELRAELLLMLGEQNIPLMRTAHATALLKQAYDLAQTLGDPGLKAHTACAWAREIANTGQAERGLAMIRDVLRRLPDQPIETGARMWCLGYAVQVANFLGDSGQAVAFATQQSELARRLPTASPLLREDAFATLADALRMAGRNAEADDGYRASTALLTSMGADQSMQMVVQLNNWGLAVWSAGRPREAAELFRRALATAGGLSTTGVLPAYLYNSYGHVLLSLARPEEAFTAFQQALDAAQRTGDTITVLKAHRGLATANLDLSRIDDAAREQATAETLMKKMLPPTHRVWAMQDADRGRLAFARGDVVEARARIDRSLAVESRDANLASDYTATLLLRARVELAQQQPEAARADAQQALDLALRKHPADIPSEWLGRCYLVLGQALLALGRHDAAADALRAAARHVGTTAGDDHPLARQAQALLAD